MGKIHHPTDKDNRISGIRGKLDKNDCKLTESENRGHKKEMSKNVTGKTNNCEETSKVDREISGGSQGNSARTIALQTITNAENEGPVVQRAELRNKSDVVSRMQTGTAVVVQRDGIMEWESHSETQPRCDTENDKRCLETGMGSNMQWTKDTGTLDTRGESTSHKCAGNESSNVCHSGFHKIDGKCTHPHSSGQHDDSGQHKQNGQHIIRAADNGNKRVVELLSTELDHTYSRVPTRETESTSRFSVKDIFGREQLEIEPGNFSAVDENLGAVSDRSVRRPEQCTAGKVRQLETGPIGRSDRCFHTEMDKESVPISTVLHDRQMPGKSTTGQSGGGDNNAGLVHATMVCEIDTDEHRLPSPIANEQQHFDEPLGTKPPDGRAETAEVGGMENLRRQWTAEGFSKQAVDIMEQSRRTGTKSAYDCAWGKWVGWCVARKMDPFHASVADITNFLSSKFEEGLEYTTINGYRSAISAYHPEIDGCKVGQHPKMKQFLAGVFNMRPPTPKYSETWDVNKVLDFIRNLGDNGDLNDKDLTQKLVMLIALTNVTRAHEIQGLKLNYVEDHGNKIILHTANLTKTKRPNKPKINFTLLEYEAEKTLDVVDCFRHYIKRTKAWRGEEEEEKQIFIGLVEPHKPVATSTISRWLKELMSRAGINTEKFKAHSVRGASTSKAMVVGVPIDQILDKANWSKENTFYKFYYKTVNNRDCFQMKILE